MLMWVWKPGGGQEISYANLRDGETSVCLKERERDVMATYRVWVDGGIVAGSG